MTIYSERTYRWKYERPDTFVSEIRGPGGVAHYVEKENESPPDHLIRALQSAAEEHDIKPTEMTRQMLRELGES